MRRTPLFALVCLAASLFATPSLGAESQKVETESRSPLFIHYRQIQTEHFRIIFEPTDRAAALEVADCCESVYQEVTSLLDSFPKTIKVLIHGRLDLANGSYYPIPEHLNLYVTSPIDFFNGAQTESWLKGLLTHELTHYIHISYEKGWIYELSKFFGPSVKTLPGAFLPGWLLEGYTTNTETLFTQGGRGRNPIFEMVYKSHLLEGNLFSLKEAGYSSPLFPRGRIYISGYIFVRYLLNRYGESILKEIHRQMVQNPFCPHQAVQRVTGKSTEQLWDEMRTELMRHYQPYTRLSEGTALSPYRKGNWNQPLPTDSGFIFYRTDLEHAPSLMHFNPATGKESLLKKTLLTDSYSFTADQSGASVVYASFDVDLAAPGGTAYTSDLFQLTPTRSPVTRQLKWKSSRLTRGQHLWHPALSPNGQRLIAVQRVDSYSRLVEVNPDDGSVTPLFSLDQATVFTPKFSPDGNAVVFVANIRGQQDLWILDDRGARPLLMLPGSEYYPVFEDASHLLFTGDSDGDLVLYQMDLVHQTYRRLLEDPVGVLSAVPLPSDSGLAYLYSSYRSIGYRVFLSSPQQLLSSPSLPIPPPNPEAYPPPRSFAPLPERFYPNIPHLIGWTPVPFNYTEKPTREAAWGLGAFLAAQSLDQESEVQFLITFPFTVAQPNLFLTARFPIGLLDVSYQLEEQYTSSLHTVPNYSEPIYTQESYQQISFRIPLYTHHLNGETLALALTSGLSHQLEIDSSQPFSFFSPSDRSLHNAIQTHQLVQFNGFTLHYSQSTAPLAVLPEWQLFFSLGSQVVLPALTNTVTRAAAIADFSLSVPIVPRHNFFGEIHLAYANKNGLVYNFSPRGFPVAASPSKGKGVAALGYNFNFGETDLPLFSNFSLQGFAMAFFLQGQFWFDTDPELSFADSYLYAGVECTPVIGWSEGTFPVTVGVNFRFDTAGKWAFNPKSDIAPFLSVDMSFIHSYRERRPSWEGRRSQAAWRSP